MTTAQAPHAFRFTFGHHPDALRAFDIQRERAVAHQQQWSDRHAHALRELQQAYVLTGLGLTEGRTAWPLAVGVGKSESVVAFVRAQYERSLKGLPPLTLLVCMERTEQLTSLYKDILSTGVPESFVGVFHRKSAAEVKAAGLVPSVEVTETDTFPVLLATHAKMLKGEASITEVNTYRGQPRSLVVWDESLIKSRGHHLDLAKVEGANAVLGVALSDTEGDQSEAREAHAFFASRLSVLRDHFNRELRGEVVEAVTFPALADGEELRYSTALAAALLRRGAGDMERGAHDLLATFLDHVQRPVRVLPYREAGRKVGVIRFDTLIPPSLTRLIVLDASHNIRLLTGKHDADLRVTAVDCAVKTFSAVTVRHLKAGAGKAALESALSRRNSAVVREIVAEVKAWPVTEAGLIVTFKDQRRGRKVFSYVDAIKDALTDAGVDLARLSFITWGQHIGVNTFAHCTRVLLAGVLRRSALDLSSAIAGQRGDLTATEAADPEEVERVEKSEVFHNIVQAAGRGSCRNTVDGAAKPMHLALVCSDDFPAEWWQSAMPGVSVQPWKAKHAKPARLISEHERAILAALDKVSERDGYVSAKTLKALAGLTSLHRMTYSRALKGAASHAEGWGYDTSRRSFIRNPFA
ncbi:MAG: hypothetical protein O9284_09900 [Steroidobacteraceae bacterium]|nr:hypothetical protein [Steroidobacteraceae bacterium]